MPSAKRFHRHYLERASGTTDGPLLRDHCSVVVVVVVLTLTNRHNTMQSVVAGQAPITLECIVVLRKRGKGG